MYSKRSAQSIYGKDKYLYSQQIVCFKFNILTRIKSFDELILCHQPYFINHD